ncbi:YcjX family protein [Vibrio zhugei]|uniref:YcjX family protein n=1 Tax=Vibrio zhugei TaxID=2479546 RepID=A0ABV7C9F7_9VIBR
MSLRKDMAQLVHRTTDSHIRLAVTGLSRAGKTAFITSLVNQLLHSSSHDNLPLFSAARDHRLIGARRVPQTNLMVPRFSYDEAEASLYGVPPAWPEPTRDVSEIRLAIRYRPQKRTKRLLSSQATLYLDIIDYPGEWLLDLPLLELDFFAWSQQQMQALHGQRKAFAAEWLSALEALDLHAPADEQVMANIAKLYTDYLHRCKAEGLHWVQPGRFVLPGELAGAPVLQFFPVVSSLASEEVPSGSYLTLLQARYQEYQSKVVKRFYKQYFSTFDRQLVLVDCLSPLNAGFDSFMDMRSALEQLMHSFRYGRSGLLSRLFAPKIDKVVFAATKADHITPDQHTNLVSLLQQMVHPAWQHAAFENIDMSCISMASVRATQSGYIAVKDTQHPAIQGTLLTGEEQTLYPGDVPEKLPDPEYFEQHRFDFSEFRPLRSERDAPLAHIRLDKALDVLLGDKLR